MGCVTLAGRPSDQQKRCVGHGAQPRGFDDEHERKDEHVQRTRRTEFNLGLAIALLIAMGAWCALAYALALLVP